ncbi:hypothetical protein D3C87_1987530 [compost metagenome]
MAQEGLDQRVGQGVKVVPGGGERPDIGHLDAVDPFHRHDVPAGPFPVDCRNPETGIVAGIFRDFRQGRGFEPEVHLNLGGLLQRAGHFDRP